MARVVLSHKGFDTGSSLPEWREKTCPEGHTTGLNGTKQPHEFPKISVFDDGIDIQHIHAGANKKDHRCRMVIRDEDLTPTTEKVRPGFYSEVFSYIGDKTDFEFYWDTQDGENGRQTVKGEFFR